MVGWTRVQGNRASFAFAGTWQCQAGGKPRRTKQTQRLRFSTICLPRGMVLPRRRKRIREEAQGQGDSVSEVTASQKVPSNGGEDSTVVVAAPDLFAALDELQRPSKQKDKMYTSPTRNPGEDSILLAANLEPRTMRAFILQPKPRAFELPRRAWKGDPIFATAELKKMVVRPDSGMASKCCDPRVTGSLKDWIRNAKSWRIVEGSIPDAKLVEEFNSRPEQKSRVIVIGDVHGCIDELERLLRVVGYAPGDQVIFLGDLVAKGPASLDVVQLAREINAKSCRGNHDHRVISWRASRKRGSEPKTVSVEHRNIAEAMPEEDMHWMMNNPWFLSYPPMGMIFVHAGLEAGVALSHQRPYMMMNMRSLSSTGNPTTRRGSESWAKSWEGPETVVFGHDATRGVQRHKKAIGLDSGCVHGGRLTALILPEKRLLSVPARRKYKQLHM